MVEIKLYNGEDDLKSQISSLMTSCLIGEYGENVKTPNIDEMLNYYHSRQDSIIYYGLDDDKFVGFMWVIESSDLLTSEPFCFFLYLGIINEYRDKGFGKKLMSYAIEQAKQKGINEIKLSVRADNQKAVSIYKSLGFKENKYEMLWTDKA